MLLSVSWHSGAVDVIKGALFELEPFCEILKVQVLQDTGQYDWTLVCVAQKPSWKYVAQTNVSESWPKIKDCSVKIRKFVVVWGHSKNKISVQK